MGKGNGYSGYSLYHIFLKVPCFALRSPLRAHPARFAPRNFKGER
jgi:hypothetical protein